MLLPSPRQLKDFLPRSKEQDAFITASQNTIKSLLSGKDSRMAIVVGPCSIHDKEATLEYAHYFKELAVAVAKSCFLVMRVYIEKSRTCLGWKGYLYDPYLDGSNDIYAGVKATRELLLTLASMEIPAAAEFVDPLAAPYFSDLISWGFIGARTASSQPHRQLASFLSCPVGFKNATDGNVDEAIHGVISAQNPHDFLFMDEEGRIDIIQSSGNPHTHIVLRGAYEFTNFGPSDIAEALQKLRIAELSPRLLIDCSHGNSQKKHEKQKISFSSVLEQMENNPYILGVMLESHLHAGNQPIEFPLQYATSITDPCLDWPSTKELILQASKKP